MDTPSVGAAAVRWNHHHHLLLTGWGFGFVVGVAVGIGLNVLLNMVPDPPVHNRGGAPSRTTNQSPADPRTKRWQVSAGLEVTLRPPEAPLRKVQIRNEGPGIIIVCGSKPSEATPNPRVVAPGTEISVRATEVRLYLETGLGATGTALVLAPRPGR